MRVCVCAYKSIFIYLYVCVCTQNAWCFTNSAFTTAVSAADILQYVFLIVVAADCAFVVAAAPATI